jgi:hypothetical protein
MPDRRSDPSATDESPSTRELVRAVIAMAIAGVGVTAIIAWLLLGVAMTCGCTQASWAPASSLHCSWQRREAHMAWREGPPAG